MLFLGSFRENQKLYSEASPIRYVSKMSPPTLFIEGEKDSYKVGRPEMQQKLRDAGVPTELVSIEGCSTSILDEPALAGSNRKSHRGLV